MISMVAGLNLSHPYQHHQARRPVKFQGNKILMPFKLFDQFWDFRSIVEVR